MLLQKQGTVIPFPAKRGGLFGMTWESVLTVLIFVAGAVTATAFHNDTLAATLAGAAAGFAFKDAKKGEKANG